MVTKKVSYIFVNTKCNNFEYKNAESRGKCAEKLFKGVLDFDIVEVFENLSKS